MKGVMTMNDEILSLIKFYKEDKITRHVLEKELTLKLAGNRKLFFEIVDNKSHNTATSFILAVLPYADCGVIKSRMIIDANVFRIYEAKEILKMINLELSNVTARMRKFYKFIKKAEVPPVSESLAFFLGLYKDTLISLKTLDFNQISKASILPRTEDIDKLITAANNNTSSIESLIERVYVADILPEAIITFAKDLSKSLNDCDIIRVVDSQDVNDLPSINAYFNRIEAVCTSTYGARPMSTKIRHDYIPETNQ